MPQPVFILGPTASGKSDLALRVARAMNAEICCVDAFQVYRGLDIGTAKPTAEERAEIPHHLIDLAGAEEAFSVADYLQAAGKVLEDLQRRGVNSVWVGGTGFYYRALRRGLSQAPASDLAIIKELEKLPLEALQQEIRDVDPAWAAEADLQNPRRVLRALAVIRQTGKPMSWWHGQMTPALLPKAAAICLVWQRDNLKARIEKRVDAMWEAGWVDEVRALNRNPAWVGSQSFQAIGYADVLNQVEGAMTAPECRESVVRLTGQYAKRQLTWFRAEPEVGLVEIDERSPIDPLVQRLLRQAG